MTTQNPQAVIATPTDIKRVPSRVICSIAARIAKNYQPEKIILFGSYAYGRPTPSSDIDLLVVMDAPLNEVETAGEILKGLPPQPFSIDLLVRSQEMIDNRIALGDWFLKEVTARGTVLYERNNS
jgi:uncharacterized protein